MKTTTELMREDQDERDTNLLNMAIRDFIKRFEPEERRDRLDFEMALHHLVRQIYREASKPYERAISLSLALTPPPPIVIPSANKPID